MIYSKSYAVLSECGTYRYSLKRSWGSYLLGSPSCVFVMLNPSTADHSKDDPTIRKCVKFADRWGFDCLEVMNLFALRATDPKIMMRHSKPVGIDNDFHIRGAVADAGKIICAWGVNGSHMNRSKEVLNLINDAKPHHVEIEALRISPTTSQPWHPLYIPDATEPLTMWQQRKETT